MKNANEAQADPTKGDQDVWPIVIEQFSAKLVDAVADTKVLGQIVEDMKERHALGISRYGTPLQTRNGRDSVMDAYQEVLDLRAYLEQTRLEDGVHVLTTEIELVDRLIIYLRRYGNRRA